MISGRNVRSVHLPILQQAVILNEVFIVKFPVIVVVVYAVTSAVNEDEYKMGAGNAQGEGGAGVIVRLPATALRRIVDEIVSRRPTRNGHVYRPVSTADMAVKTRDDH